MPAQKLSPLQKLPNSEIPRALPALQKAIMTPGSLDGRLKVLAYLAASFINECPFSVAQYRTLATEAGYSEDDLRAVQTEQDHLLPPIDRAAVRIARELTSTSTIDDVDSNLIHMFTDDALVELVSVICLANFDNRFNNAFDIEQNQSSVSSGGSTLK